MPSSLFSVASMLLAFNAVAMDVTTPYGNLEERRQETSDGEYKNSIALDGKDVLRQKYGYLFIVKAATIGKTTHVVVVAGEGAISCPSLYRVLTISSPTKIAASEEFGTCADVANAYIAKGLVRVSMPDYIPHEEYLTAKEIANRYSRTFVFTVSNNRITKKIVRSPFVEESR